jgi:hypothetical protein
MILLKFQQSSSLITINMEIHVLRYNQNEHLYQPDSGIIAN